MVGEIYKAKYVFSDEVLCKGALPKIQSNYSGNWMFQRVSQGVFRQYYEKREGPLSAMKKREMEKCVLKGKDDLGEEVHGELWNEMKTQMWKTQVVWTSQSTVYVDSVIEPALHRSHSSTANNFILGLLRGPFLHSLWMTQLSVVILLISVLVVYIYVDNKTVS